MSSEYTTDSDLDDDSWASEDNSAASTDESEQAKERTREESGLAKAAEEAQRQRDMFAKVPKRFYSGLNRTKSGLLSQLLNPDLALFPPNHPYHQYPSTTDMTQLGRMQQSSAVCGARASGDVGAGPAVQGVRLPPPNHLTSKGSAAMPVATPVMPLAAQVSPSASERYRPKGCPQDAEMDSDSEEEGDNGIQLSRSLAQQKLAALAGPQRRQTAPPEAPQQQPRAELQQRQPQAVQVQGLLTPMMVQMSPTVTVATPIPLGHPYNLPAPAPPMTPRTTRRHMLATELSESLRRNLLWERQVSKMNLTSGARRGGLSSSRLQPMAAMKNGGSRQVGPGGGSNPPPGDDREERKAAIARNKGWVADEYHQAGW